MADILVPRASLSFNTVEGWSRDISAEVAEELRRRCDLHARHPFTTQNFIDDEAASPRQLTLRLSKS